MIVHSVLLFFVPCSYGLLVTTDTDKGQVRGYRITTHPPGQLDVYLGIPFAEVPVGRLRFAPPQEKASWRPHVLNATTFAPACPQPLGFLQK
jgi:carboxylesterase type B